MDKDKKMPIPEGKISSLRMEPADNGVIICYDVQKKKTASKGSFDNCSYEYKKEVFDVDGESKEGLNEAFERYKELWVASYKK